MTKSVHAPSKVTVHAQLIEQVAVWATVLVIIAFVFVSGYANFATWTDGKVGIDFHVSWVTAIGSEILGATLIYIGHRLFRQNWLAAIACFLLALVFIFNNASASWTYYAKSDTAELVHQEEQKLAVSVNLANERIGEIKTRMDFIGQTEPAASLQSQIDQLPANYKTQRNTLTAKLALATEREKLADELKTKRDIVETASGAGVTTAAAVSMAAVPASTGFTITNLINKMRSNRFATLTSAMEVMKAFGFVLVAMLGKHARALQQPATIIEPTPAKARKKAKRKAGPDPIESETVPALPKVAQTRTPDIAPEAVVKPVSKKTPKATDKNINITRTDGREMKFKVVS